MYLHSVVIISNHIVKIVSFCIFVIVYWCFMYLLKYYRRGHSVLRTVLSRSGGNICSDFVLKVKTTCICQGVFFPWGSKRSSFFSALDWMKIQRYNTDFNKKYNLKD